MKIPKLRVTRCQAFLMMDLGLGQKLGVDVSRPMRVCVKDCDDILASVQRRGRTGMSLRRRVIALRNELTREGAPR